MVRPRSKKPPRYAAIQKIALGLPGAVEEPHRNGPWFNVGKRPFALYWARSASWMIRLPADHVMMLVTVGAGVFRPMRNGSPFWVYIDAAAMDGAMLRDYLTAAWKHTAPKKMQKGFDGEDAEDTEGDEAFA